MLTRRKFLERNLKASSLLSLGAIVPQFVASTAQADEHGKDNILVIVELSGGNDGLNTVIPYGDDLYQKARPTLHFNKNEVIRINDQIGLNPALRLLNGYFEDQQVAIVQGVGYPNPNRSHFESMDTWQSADPSRKMTTGWLARSLNMVKVSAGSVPAFHVGDETFPLALTGAADRVSTFDPQKPFGLQLSQNRSSNTRKREKATDGRVDTHGSRMKLIRELTNSDSSNSNSLLQFVRRTSLQTYATIESLKEIVAKEKLDKDDSRFDGFFQTSPSDGLQFKLNLIASMIRAEFGTRIFYVSLAGFDTHSEQKSTQDELLNELDNSIASLFAKLKESGDEKRVLLLTYSEFGRRVQENDSKGTDHGAASNMFLVGPSVRGGLIGEHPSLEADKLDSGDLSFHTDFRRVYATILDRWLHTDSRRVLGKSFDHVDCLN